MCNINHPKLLCRICAKNAHEKDKAVQLIACCSTIFSFNSLSSNKNVLACCTNTDSYITQWKGLENDHIGSLSLKPTLNLELLVNQCNNATPGNSNNPESFFI